MLVLARKLNQRICIGDEVVIEVVGIDGGVIRLGVTAPRNVQIHREEIYDSIVRQVADDPTRQVVDVMLNRAEARAVADCLHGGEELARVVGDRLDTLLAEKYA